METLDDLVLSDPGSVLELEQLKHSIRSGVLTDRSPVLWGALENWLDYVGTSQMDRISQMILVATAKAPPDSAASFLRGDDRQPDEAERRLLVIAQERPGNNETRKARQRFDGLSSRDRGALLSKVIVRDGTPPITGFREQLRAALGVALPQNGVDDFLDRLVGWWERRVVDLLVRRIKTVSYDEVADEIARLRNMYNDSDLPPADPKLNSALTDSLAEAYAKAVFVHQLQFVALQDQRIRLAISDYHRAYAQRSVWLQEGILGTEEVSEWEERLVDEWQRARLRMIEVIQDSDEEGAIAAGRALLDELEQSNHNPLRTGRDRFLHTGTLHGLADVRHVGWHPDYESRLATAFGPKSASQPTSSTYEEVGESA